MQDAVLANDSGTLMQLVQKSRKTANDVHVAHVAAKVGSTDSLATLVQMDPAFLVGEDGQRRTPLHCAVDKGNVDAAALCLEVRVFWWAGACAHGVATPGRRAHLTALGAVLYAVAGRWQWHGRRR